MLCVNRLLFLCLTIYSGSVYGISAPWGYNFQIDELKRIPLRGLKLGAINFLHTTDTHGWLGSHPVQDDYSADWGHFVSFVDQFKQHRLGDDQDLLVIDTGDKLDGNGLSDATVPNGVATTPIFNELDYDLLTLGNHELYSEDRAVLEYYSTAQSEKFRKKYVSSNVNFVNDLGEEVTFGNKYVYFETPKNKYRTLAMSFIFNYQTTNKRAKVTKSTLELEKPWFQEMLKQYNETNLDLLIIFGHLPASDPDQELNQLHESLRNHFGYNLTIQYFGGHSHIRDFVSLDDRSTCIQSGRFSETAGFLSIDNVTNENPKFFRRYIDFNKRSFSYHANVPVSELQTLKGENVSKSLNKLTLELGLNEQYGYVKENYYMMTRPMDSPNNIYNLIINKILPRLQSNTTGKLVANEETNGNHKLNYRYVMLNTGAIRFDLFHGPYTRGTEFSVLPFPNTWKYISLPLWISKNIETYLNREPVIAALSPPGLSRLLKMQSERPSKCPFIKLPLLSEGYTTMDDFGCDGDDTLHNSQRIYPIPNVIQYNNIPNRVKDDNIKLEFIFFGFLQDDVLAAIDKIQVDLGQGRQTRNYTSADSLDYNAKPLQLLLREYIMST